MKSLTLIMMTMILTGLHSKSMDQNSHQHLEDENDDENDDIVNRHSSKNDVK